MKIGFIGGGNMAGAMIGGMLKQGYTAADIFVLEPDADRRNQLTGAFGIRTETHPCEVLSSDLLILAVKPQVLRSVLITLPKLSEQTCVLSIAAGIRAGDIARWLQGHAAVVRAMPNTPALVGAGITGLFALPGVSAEQKEAAEQALNAIGQVVWVADEAMIDAVTAISGSGPAYVFLFIEALEAAALDLGFDAEAARLLALHTGHGSATLAVQDGSDPAVLRARVTSKGGTTERGLAALEEHGLRQAVLAAARAAAARAKELGDQLGGE
jgi:pyrroline-5-carboxylate reductase